MPADPLAEDPDHAAEAIRAALNRARAAAQARGARPGDLGSGSSAWAREQERRAGAQRRSGARPDGRDPQGVAGVLSRLVVEHGWSEPVAVGSVLGRWDTVVGADLAAHCHPVSFEDGVLTVAAQSSAWAVQVRLLMPTVMRRLEEELGTGLVQRVAVLGPQAPSWRHGPRVAPGSRGPGDTYG